ncbi:hypothetical protein DY000_02052069 [Brassica cretica]|uniref:Cation-transporting P-type ATPase N-terminal domain-containing protein n=1 Tax=Brassica cretica TaxID=69181 RepID=A0ABQ7ABQ2_BRACR|nr:hypothetical protein DY000_02052069 [Brassica cretica]
MNELVNYDESEMWNLLTLAARREAVCDRLLAAGDFSLSDLELGSYLNYYSQIHGEKDRKISRRRRPRIPHPPRHFQLGRKPSGECEEKFGVSREKGLDTDEVAKRHQIYSLNELEKPEGTSIFKLILEQFNDTLVRILLAAAIISFVLAFIDGDEGGKMVITADQCREGVGGFGGDSVSAGDCYARVPGDILELRVGDKVPADMRVVALVSSTLRVEQGSLTGESEAVSNTTKPVE